MAQERQRPTDGQKIATLIRILRSATASGDKVLIEAATSELTSYGIDVAKMHCVPLTPHDGGATQ